MTCPKCQSENVTVQVTTDVQIKTQHKGVVWWLLIGWWWVMLKWLFLTLPALLVKIFKKKKQVVVQTERKICVCHSCGHTWNI